MAKKKRSPFVEEVMILLMKIGAIVLLLVILWIFMFGAMRTKDNSMSPAVHEGDLLLYYRLDKDYVASDLLVLNYKGKSEVRRVIATAGDKVNITEDGLEINNAPQQEPRITEETKRYNTNVKFPLIVKKGQVFVLADARENATDSRVYGVVAVSDTKGKVITVIRRRGF